MFRTSYLLAPALVGSLALPGVAFGQDTSPNHPHMVVVKLVQKGGSMPYAFAPGTVTVERGDTVRFIEDAGAMHNVHFTAHPPGAKLGSAATGPYLTSLGQKYDVVIDARFTEGKYEFVCDPHAALGMHGTMLVVGNTTPDAFRNNK